MKLKGKIVVSLVGIFTVFLLVNPIKVKAALQANGNLGKIDTIGNWLMNIRKMEATGGTLGLTGNVNADLTSEAVNNLDIHMQKNTEYGAMAILSASAYGNQNKIEDGQTTTGNKSGIYIQLNKEWVAAGCNGIGVGNFNGAVDKYKDVYTTGYVAKVGDAIAETSGWHGSGASSWIRWADKCGLVRAHSGSLFSYYGYIGNSYYDSYDAFYTRAWSSRAVIVVGNGF